MFASPLDVQVLYLTEPLDEMTIQAIDSFDGKALVDAAKGDIGDLLDLDDTESGDDDEET